MATTIQIRSVDEALARAAKEEAARRGMTLSDYLKDLIAADLDEEARLAGQRRVLDEIASQEPVADLTPAATLKALRDVRREMGTL